MVVYVFKVLSFTNTWLPYVPFFMSPFRYEFSLCCWPSVLSFFIFLLLLSHDNFQRLRKWPIYKNTRKCLQNLSWFIHSKNRMCLLVLYILLKKICKINCWSLSFSQTNSLSSLSHMLALLRLVCVAQADVCIDPLLSSVSGMLSFNCQVK